jgi:hypothetical protein
LVRLESGFSGPIHQMGAFARRKWPRLTRISNDDGNRSALFNSLLSVEIPARTAPAPFDPMATSWK